MLPDDYHRERQSICQDISSHVIDCPGWMRPCLPPGRISMSCAISPWKMMENAKNLMFPNINSALQGLANLTILVHWPSLRSKWCQAIANSVCCSNAVWQHSYGSTLARVMDWCHQATSHYLNQCWIIISDVLWHSYEGNSRENAQDIYPWCGFEN